jgi:nitroreductase
MELLEAIKGRRSVRDFTGETVADATLRELIDAAIHAPSAMNQQPWSFVIVKNQALLADISEKAKAYLLDAAQGSLPQHFSHMLSDPNFHIFYHAPVLIVIAVVEPTGWAVEDCALAAQDLMLTAYAAGLGTCWIGFAQGWLGTAEGKSALGLPASHVPVAPIIIGYPKHKPASVPRKEPELRWIE